MDPSSNKQENKAGTSLSTQAEGDKRRESSTSAKPDITPVNNLLAMKEQCKKECLRYIPLVKAVLSGDWESAKRFFDQDPTAVTARITEMMETALHILVGTGKYIHFVENLVGLIPAEALPALTDDGGRTALHIAAWVGNTEAARVLVQQHPRLLYVRDNTNWLPIHRAAINARRDTLSYLLTVTENDPVSLPFSNVSGAQFIIAVITSNLYDIALNVVDRYPHLATLRTPNKNCALARIATKVSSFPSGSHLNFWQRIIYSCVPVKVDNPVNISQVTHVHKDNWAQSFGENFFSVPQIKHIREQKVTHLQALQLVKSLCEKISASLNDRDAYLEIARDSIVIASNTGIREVIEEIAEWFPNLIWARDLADRNFFRRGIIHRHENIFNLTYQMSDQKRIATNFLEQSWDTMLHLAGRLAPRNKLNLVPGAALQMQRELQWFKEVKKFVNPMYIDFENKKGETAAVVFTKEHKDLVVEGEKWMKDTANSCTIVAALIATMVFAAAITVPGGNNSEKGTPIFSKRKVFIIFAVSDAISLFTSTTSLLMFLSILTSRYAEQDFLYALPKRLIIGLFTLFLSITTMMVAFSTTLYLVFGHNKEWILIPVAALSCLPITSFVTLQFPLLQDLISSTYGRGIFGKQSDRLLY
ncbi:uncharacterized protein LOC131308721 isoform X2 [Rhododendron vialii]|uniref:uncharacterized protein LOC131308721 isoform X2 n=1 Tax=Rhododendron vialii TaxID=182163 RepID=UPI00265E5990|nr:uncharacterized protein LOC131308721 isoform X2 [Rhododendron vialii]